MLHLTAGLYYLWRLAGAFPNQGLARHNILNRFQCHVYPQTTILNLTVVVVGTIVDMDSTNTVPGSGRKAEVKMLAA